MIDQEKIHNQCLSTNPEVRAEASKQISENFPMLPYKQKAWNILVELTKDEDWRVRSMSASILGSVFSDVPDKQKAWKDLHRLTNSEEKLVRSRAASALDSAFPYLPDKQQAWNDLHRLTSDEASLVRYWATSALSSTFPLLPDKQRAWDDLHRLTNDRDNSVKSMSASALGSAFSYLPDRQQAWNDLHRLTSVENRFVRSRAASALGSAYSYIQDKQQVWDVLCKLANDQEEDVRAYANYSLGKISIIKASQAEKEENYKEELEIAIAFFEKVSLELWFNPAQFCLSFYRSFYTMIFRKQNAKEEMDKYLAEAKYAVGSSESKELLFKAIENLANALKEVQSLENLDFEAKKGELNFYKQYCDRAAELMIETEETAPFAITAMRKGLPILDRNLKELLEEIQKKAKVACKEFQGTPKAEIACTINREIQDLEIGSQEEMKQKIQDLAYLLRSKVMVYPDNEYLLSKIEMMKNEKILTKQYEILLFVIGNIGTMNVIRENVALETIREAGKNLEKKLDEFCQEVAISLNSGIREEIIISTGFQLAGSGVQHSITIPLQEISYAELQEDLERIRGRTIDKLTKLPKRLDNKVREYLVQKNMWSILEKLT